MGVSAEALMQLAGQVCRDGKAISPKGAGLAVVTFDYGGAGHMGYASTADRQGTIGVLRELLRNFERDEKAEGA